MSQATTQPNAQNHSEVFSPDLLKSMIKWVRSGLVPHPCGIQLVAGQIITSLDQGQSTLDTLGTCEEEIKTLWNIARTTKTEEECQEALQAYYHPIRVTI